MDTQHPFQPRACRVCLATDVTLFNIYKIGVAEIIGDLIRTPVVLSDGLPQYVCWYCRAQLERCMELRARCRRAHFRCQEIFVQQLVIPTDTIRKLDKSEFAIPLMKTKCLQLEYAPTTTNMNNLDDIPPPFTVNDINHLHTDFSNNGMNQDVQEEKVTNEMLCHIEPIEEVKLPTIVNIKSEVVEVELDPMEEQDKSLDLEVNHINVDTMPQDTEMGHDESPETDPIPVQITPLYLEVGPIFGKDDNEQTMNSKNEEISSIVVKHEPETLPEPKTKPKPKKRAPKRVNTQGKVLNAVEPKPKRSKKYNQKYEDEYEDFCKEHDVKVVCLTLEEQIARVQARRTSKQYTDSRFSCDVCYKGFMSITAHKRHMETHDPSAGAHECPVCLSRHPTLAAMLTHRRRHHKIFVCNLCGNVSANTDRARLHHGSHTGRTWECEPCAKTFNAHTTYLNHLRETHKEARCEQCALTFSGTNELHAHNQTAHQQCVCDMCRVAFKSEAALTRHYQAGCDSKCIPCRLCGAKFFRRVTLSDHLRHAHADDGQVYACEQCPSAFTSDRALSNHFSSRHYTVRPGTGGGRAARAGSGGGGGAARAGSGGGGGAARAGSVGGGGGEEGGPADNVCHTCGEKVMTERCNTCEGVFCSRDAFIAHMDNVCKPNGRSCAQCGENFPGADEMVRHCRDTHHQLTCPQCDGQLPSAMLYKLVNVKPPHKPARAQREGRPSVDRGADDGKKRVRSHLNPLELMCEQCGRGNFKCLSLLHAHQRTHTGEKPFICDYCQKGFREMQGLKFHMTCHTNERRYPCPHCDKKFKQHAARSSHILTHTKERPFACTSCNKRYTGRTSLKEHVNTVHKGLPPRQRGKNKDKQEM